MGSTIADDDLLDCRLTAEKTAVDDAGPFAVLAESGRIVSDIILTPWLEVLIIVVTTL